MLPLPQSLSMYNSQERTINCQRNALHKASAEIIPATWYILRERSSGLINLLNMLFLHDLFQGRKTQLPGDNNEDADGDIILIGESLCL